MMIVDLHHFHIMGRPNALLGLMCKSEKPIYYSEKPTSRKKKKLASRSPSSQSSFVAAQALPHRRICRRRSNLTEMDNETKQERFRTRWTASLDKIFVDLIVEQIKLGNRPNNVFDKKTWGQIRDGFNRQSGLDFNNNQLRKHYDVLRIRYNNIKSAMDQNNFSLEDSSNIGFDLWESLGVQTRPEPVKIKDCPIFEQLCIMFADNGVEGKYAQSSHYEDVENKSSFANLGGLGSYNDIETPGSVAPSSSRRVEDNMASAKSTPKPVMELKRKRLVDTQSSGVNGNEGELQEAMAEALLDMIAASKLTASTLSIRDDGNLSITNCIRALDDIQGINEGLYYIAVDLFEEPNLREVFLSLNSKEKRLMWLQLQHKI